MVGVLRGGAGAYVAGMNGHGLHPRLVGVRTFGDEVLAAIAPLGLALAAGRALVVDADPHAVPYPGERTVRSIADEGPTRAEIRPDRGGIAVLPAGGADRDQISRVIGLLGEAWPLVVVRVGEVDQGIPVVPVRPLWPGFLAPLGQRASVWQRVRGGGAPPGPGPVLPIPPPSTVAALLSARRPLHSRWVRAWRRVWELPWE